MINGVLVVENKNAGATVSDIHVYLERGLNGKWKVKDNKLIEIIDSDSGNDFAGKTNAMPLTLSAHGNVIHIVWTRPATGEPVGEYYMRVPTRNLYLEGN